VLASMSSLAPIMTSRLLLRPPALEDAQSIFQSYASNAEVTRLVGWPRHKTIGDTQAFLEFAASEWKRWPAGPLLIESRGQGTLLGSTGLAFETIVRASTGYVLAREAWGQGFASEALTAIVALARELHVTTLYATCHASHSASIRVLERCGFSHEDTLTRHLVFPNLGDEKPQDVATFAYLDGASKIGPSALAE
jgi:ribosomal-protein-alanine N-acetyltransferase